MKKLQVQELAEMLKRPEIIALLSQASKPAVPAFEEWANYWLETYRLGKLKTLHILRVTIHRSTSI